MGLHTGHGNEDASDGTHCCPEGPVKPRLGIRGRAPACAAGRQKGEAAGALGSPGRHGPPFRPQCQAFRVERPQCDVHACRNQSRARAACRLHGKLSGNERGPSPCVCVSARATAAVSPFARNAWWPNQMAAPFRGGASGIWPLAGRSRFATGTIVPTESAEIKVGSMVRHMISSAAATARIPWSRRWALTTW